PAHGRLPACAQLALRVEARLGRARAAESSDGVARNVRAHARATRSSGCAAIAQAAAAPRRPVGVCLVRRARSRGTDVTTDSVEVVTRVLSALHLLDEQGKLFALD